jgi:hypothetical protein
MSTVNEQIGEAVAKLSVSVLGALLSGTIVWLIWGTVVPYFFSTLVSYGVPVDPTWWMCVLLMWFIGSFRAKVTVTKTE